MGVLFLPTATDSEEIYRELLILSDFCLLLLDNCWVLSILLLYFNEEKETRNSFHVTICKFSFLHLTATQYSTACITHTIALKFSGKEHVECFLHFATTNNASIDICIHSPLDQCESYSAYTSRSGRMGVVGYVHTIALTTFRWLSRKATSIYTPTSCA